MEELRDARERLKEEMKKMQDDNKKVETLKRNELKSKIKIYHDNIRDDYDRDLKDRTKNYSDLQVIYIYIYIYN